MQMMDHRVLSREEEQELFKQLILLRPEKSEPPRVDYKNLRRHIAGYYLKLMMKLVHRISRSCGQSDPDASAADATCILYNAIDRFDPVRGYKFSTYLYWALVQSLPRTYSHKGRSVRGNIEPIHENIPDKAVEECCYDELRKIRLAVEALVDQRDREIIKRRFGLGYPRATLDDIGKLIGLSKERTRQLETRALNDLRKLLVTGDVR